MTTAVLQKTSEPEWAALAAIDWADRKHFWKVRPANSDKVEAGEMDQTPESVDAWAMDLHQRFGGRPIAVCLEQSRGALVCLLAKYPHLVLFPVHPKTAAQYRQTFRPSGAKDDPSDTGSLLDLLERHQDKLRRQLPDTVETRLLQILAETRRRLVDERTRQKNRLTACLKIYFPQLLQWFDDVASPLVGALLQKWATLQQLQHTHRGTLRTFFRQQNCRAEERIQQRIAAIGIAIAATEDAAILEGESRKAQAFAAVIATLNQQIRLYDDRIAEVVASHPDGALFASFPGVGPALLPRLIVAFGSDRERFSSAEEVQCFTGIAPVTEASGQSKWVHKRRAAPRFPHQTLHEFAGHSIAQSEWAKAFYTLLRDKGKPHHTAVRALAYKWIRILYRCWKDVRPYDERLYLASLRRRNSPITAALTPNTGGAWISVAGFQKLAGDFS